MLYALDVDGNRVLADNAEKKKEYTCQCCGESVVFRKGDIKMPHFAHKSGTQCYVTDNDMCEWHKRMQMYFPDECREVVFKHNGEVHRADICIGKYIIEFQHSSISLGDYERRTNFYVNLGYKVVWVFDTSDWLATERIEFACRGDYEFTVKRPLELWKHIDGSDKVSICFCELDKDGKDKIYKVTCHSEDWKGIIMNYFTGFLEMRQFKDDAPLDVVFEKRKKKEEIDELLNGKEYDTVYRLIRGYRKDKYLCKCTGDWARDCDSCTNCLLIKFAPDGRGNVVYCDKAGHRRIDNTYQAPTIYGMS